MNNISKGLYFTTAVALAGCIPMEQTIKDTPTIATPAPATIKESLPQICRDAKENAVRANDMYINKGLSASGEIKSIKDGYSTDARYWVFIYAGDVKIHAGTNNENSVKRLSTGTTTQVVGTITSVTYDFYGCSIALHDATF